MQHYKFPAIAIAILAWGVSSQGAQSAGLELVNVTENVYAVVGPLSQRNPENLGNNATFGFVVTADGVILIDPGGTAKGAARIDALIRTVTDAPISVVINTGGQDHRWLGNGYFQQRGATIIANERAVADQRERQVDQFFLLGNLVGDEGIEGTDPVFATDTFDQELKFVLGTTQVEIRHAGAAHTPGDSFVWLPQQRVVFTGDIVYVERMPGVSSYSSSRTWLEAFSTLAELEPAHLVPGHGPPTSVEHATRDTYDYLVFLRRAVAGFIDAGGGIEAIGDIDQSPFSYLENYEALKGRNAQRVFDELEWE